MGALTRVGALTRWTHTIHHSVAPKWRQFYSPATLH